jgi:hypothetical protein
VATVPVGSVFDSKFVDKLAVAPNLLHDMRTVLEFQDFKSWQPILLRFGF